jgi:CDP-diacylglycerol--glycerol-3-phosphate 3-phosphatidyltransferase
VRVFGRIADAGADKILVLGAFVLLCSPAFYDDESGIVVSGVAPWMAVLILARELVVTTIRAVVESSGASFAAVWSGKWKMIAQSLSVPMILAVVWLAEPSSLRSGPARLGLLGVAWAVVIITTLSGLHYAVLGAKALRKSDTS